MKEVLHYARGDTERGHKCMIGASRATAVLGAGVVTGGLGAGAVAGGFAGIGSGIAYDGVYSAIDSGVNEERRTHGIWNVDCDVKAYKEGNDYADVELSVVSAIVGDFMAGSSTAEAGEAIRKAVKVKAQQNNLKSSLTEAAELFNFEPEHACSNFVEGASEMHERVKDGAVNGEGHVVTKVRNLATGEVSQGFNAPAEADINVRQYRTQGKSSGFYSKSQARKAASAAERGPSSLMTQSPEVEQVVSDRPPQACAEHQALDRFYETVAPGFAPTTAQVVSVQLKNGVYQAVLRCANCLEYARCMGTVVFDLIAGQSIPVARITPCITTALAAGASIATATAGHQHKS